MVNTDKVAFQGRIALLGGGLALSIAAYFIFSMAGTGEPAGEPAGDAAASTASLDAAASSDTPDDTRPAGARGYVVRSSASGSTDLRSENSNAGQPMIPDLRRQHIVVGAALNRRAEASGPARKKVDKLVMPDWDKLFLPGGWFRDDIDERGMFGSNGLPDFMDLYDGVEADFIEENLSAGVATDMSALLLGSDYTEDVLYNGAVRAQHDLGNAYILATVGLDSHLRIYAGVERLITDEGSFIEIEISQAQVHLQGGRPWDIVGQRQDGDLLVRLVFSGGSLQSAEFERFENNAFVFLNTGPGLSGTGCYGGKEFEYCVGPPPISHPVENIELWDDEFEPVGPIVADGFVEIGVDTDRLAGPQRQYSSVLFRTPEDIAMKRFSVFQRFADERRAPESDSGYLQ